MHETSCTQRTTEMLHTAMGEQITTALRDSNVAEIMLNPDGKLWLETHEQGRIDTGAKLSAHAAERVIRLVASHIGRDASRDKPIVSAELPDGGERFEGVLPPVVGSPCFSIRKPAAKIFALTDYVAKGIMSAANAEALKAAVHARRNILIVGGTGSGKTTLANALLAEISCTNDRLIILEDTRELQSVAPDTVALRTQPGRVTLSDLVRSTLRLRPDRIIIGEVRGGEALDMLKAWNTGHPGGLATIHANSAEAGLYRLEQLIGEVTQAIPFELIVETIDCVLFIHRRDGVRRVETLQNVAGQSPDGYALTPAVTALAEVASNPLISTSERTK